MKSMICGGNEPILGAVRVSVRDVKDAYLGNCRKNKIKASNKLRKAIDTLIEKKAKGLFGFFGRSVTKKQAGLILKKRYDRACGLHPFCTDWGEMLMSKEPHYKAKQLYKAACYTSSSRMFVNAGVWHWLGSYVDRGREIRERRQQIGINQDATII